MTPSVAARAESDSEDEDYAPPAKDEVSSSESEQEENEPILAPVNIMVEDAEEKKRKRDALWADFQSSVVPTPGSEEQPPKKKVKIEKKYRFAGEETVEIVEVDEDSSDAKQWPLWKDPTTILLPSESAPDSNNIEASSLTPAAVSDEAKVSVPVATPKSGLTARKPGPRKSKTTLASLQSSTKAKKLTTLDKSAMDWQAHLQATGSSVQDELEANRRGGGYLEKVEFLQRVEDRKDQNLDAMKGSKRRKI